MFWPLAFAAKARLPKTTARRWRLRATLRRRSAARLWNAILLAKRPTGGIGISPSTSKS